MLQNSLYTLLANRTRFELQDLVGYDYVDPAYVASHRQSICEQAANLLFGEQAQAAQYWILRIRQTIENSPLFSYIDKTNARQPELLRGLAEDMAAYTEPRLTAPFKTLARIGERPQGGQYQVVRGTLELQGQALIARSATMQTITQVAVDGEVTRLVFPGEDEFGFWVPTAEFSNSSIRQYVWATKPLRTLGEHYDAVQIALSPLLSRLKELDSVFPVAVRESLLDFSTLSMQTELAAGAAALLIAGHTAYMGDVSL